MRFLKELIFTGLLRGWPGRSCPECNVRPSKPHKANCSVGTIDGGIWA